MKLASLPFGHSLIGPKAAEYISCLHLSERFLYRWVHRIKSALINALCPIPGRHADHILKRNAMPV